MLPTVAVVIALVGSGVGLTVTSSQLLERDHSSRREVSRARATVVDSFDGCEPAFVMSLQGAATVADVLADVVEQRVIGE